MTSHLRTIFYAIALLMIIPTVFQQIHKQYTALLSTKTRIGCIPIGVLKHDHEILEALHNFFERSDIKAIVLKIDSPGGAAGTSQLIFQEIIALKKQHMKPVITLVENMCASGGYYVAAAIDYIIAPPSACIGSIGAYIAYPNISKVLEQVHVKYKVTAAGAYKLALNPYTEQTPEQETLIKQLTQDTYEQFMQDIASQRSKLTLDQAKTWADGRIFTGRQAVALGLIDEIGSQNSVEQYLRSRIPVEGKIIWVMAEKKSHLTKLLNMNSASFWSSLVQLAFSQLSTASNENLSINL